MMTSVTYEEANSELGNWLRQRSRWFKGHIQTWLVHNRRPLQTWRELGTRGFLGMQFILGLFPLLVLLHPLLLLLSVYDVLARAHLGQVLLPGLAHHLAVTTLVLGNLLVIGHFAAACASRGLYRAIPTMFSLPLNWLLMSAAAYKAMGQLLRPSRRHYWELTRHGLDLPAPRHERNLDDLEQSTRS